MTTTTTDTPPATAGPGTTSPPRRPWVVVTVREIMVKLTDRNFLVSTAVTLALIAGGVALSVFMEGRAEEHRVAVASSEGRGAVETAAAGLEGDTLTAVEVGSSAEARAAVEAEEADAALLAEDDGWVLVGRDGVGESLTAVLTEGVRTYVVTVNAEAAGTSLDELAAGAGLTTELLDPGALPEGTIYAATFVFAFLFYMAAIIFGMTIAQSVLEEKQNRVVEILAAAIPIRQLLYGKVLGNSLLAFAQILLYGVVALVAVNVAGLASDLGGLVGVSGWFVLFFVAGFAALASVWAVLGSLASRSEDLQSNTGPVMGVIMVAFFAGLFAEDVWLTVASYVPVVSSVAMPVRMLGDDVALWEPAASVLLTAVTAYGLLRIGERIYQRAVMQGGTALTWRQALRLEA